MVEANDGSQHFSFNSVEKSSSVEKESPRRRARFFILRHGRPVIYGSDHSELHEEGIWQVQNFSNQFVNQLKTDENEKIVKFLMSDRERASQTAKIVETRVRRGMRRGELSRVNIKRDQHPRLFLSPNKTIDAVLDSGRETLEGAYMEWLSLSYNEAKKIKAKWTGEVALEALKLAGNFGIYINREEWKGPDLYYLLATHETTLGAILLHSMPNISLRDLKVNFADHVEIEPRTANTMALTYKGETQIIDVNSVRGKIYSQMRE